jgi:hypothetical protein
MSRPILVRKILDARTNARTTITESEAYWMRVQLAQVLTAAPVNAKAVKVGA